MVFRAQDVSGLSRDGPQDLDPNLDPDSDQDSDPDPNADSEAENIKAGIHILLLLCPFSLLSWFILTEQIRQYTCVLLRYSVCLLFIKYTHRISVIIRNVLSVI